MNEIIRIIWFAANGLLILAATGITFGNIMSKVKAAKETSQISEASSFMHVP